MALFCASSAHVLLVHCALGLEKTPFSAVPNLNLYNPAYKQKQPPVKLSGGCETKLFATLFDQQSIVIKRLSTHLAEHFDKVFHAERLALVAGHVEQNLPAM